MAGQSCRQTGAGLAQTNPAVQPPPTPNRLPKAQIGPSEHPCREPGPGAGAGWMVQGPGPIGASRLQVPPPSCLSGVCDQNPLAQAPDHHHPTTTTMATESSLNPCLRAAPLPQSSPWPQGPRLQSRPLLCVPHWPLATRAGSGRRSCRGRECLAMGARGADQRPVPTHCLHPTREGRGG